MDIRKRTVRSVVVVFLGGDLDSTSASLVQKHLLPLVASTPRVLVDMTGVPYVSSAGLRTMLLVYRQAQCEAHQVALVGLSSELRALMAATGFLHFFVVRDSVTAGIDALQEWRVADAPVPSP